MAFFYETWIILLFWTPHNVVFAGVYTITIRLVFRNGPAENYVEWENITHVAP